MKSKLNLSLGKLKDKETEDFSKSCFMNKDKSNYIVKNILDKVFKNNISRYK